MSIAREAANTYIKAYRERESNRPTLKTHTKTIPRTFTMLSAYFITKETHCPMSAPLRMTVHVNVSYPRKKSICGNKINHPKSTVPNQSKRTENKLVTFQAAIAPLTNRLQK